MTITLIYHSEESRKREKSPFDEAVRGLVTNADIAIACPYLGIEYLQEIVALCKTWRLLTDVSAWLDAHKGNANQLSLIQEFIKENINRIHHYDGIHAKVIISLSNALVGSANLTKHGIWHREEMSILIKELTQIDELLTWFNRLWEDSDRLNEQEIENIKSYVKMHSQQNRVKQPVAGFPELRLRMPRSTSALPEDFTGEEVGDWQLFTIKDITSRFSDRLEIQWDSVRRWIYYMINHGKIRVYQYKSIQLLDDDGVKELWQFRSKIQEGGKNRS